MGIRTLRSYVKVQQFLLFGTVMPRYYGLSWGTRRPEVQSFLTDCSFSQSIQQNRQPKSFLWGSTSLFSSSKTLLKRKNRKHIIAVFTERMCFLALLFKKVWFELFQFKKRGFTRLLQSLLNSNGHSDGHADHGVVACAVAAAQANA